MCRCAGEAVTPFDGSQVFDQKKCYVIYRSIKKGVTRSETVSCTALRAS